jgi:hypothetical protein
MLRVGGLDLQLGQSDQGAVRRLGVVHGRLGVTVGVPPGVGDPREPEDGLGHVADREADPAGRGAERDDHRAGAALDLEGQRVGASATAFPAAASPEDLDDLELGPVDRAPDRGPDLAPLGPAEADEPVAVPDDDRHGELEPTTGVGHPLDHVHIQDLVVEAGEELVDDLRLAERKARRERLAHRLDLVRGDPLAELGPGDPGRGSRGPAAAVAAPLARGSGDRAAHAASGRVTMVESFAR